MRQFAECFPDDNWAAAAAQIPQLLHKVEVEPNFLKPDVTDKVPKRALENCLCLKFMSSYILMSLDQSYIWCFVYRHSSSIQILKKEERVGNSSAELLTGDTHDHWLTLLGFRLPLQAA